MLSTYLVYPIADQWVDPPDRFQLTYLAHRMCYRPISAIRAANLNHDHLKTRHVESLANTPTVYLSSIVGTHSVSFVTSGDAGIGQRTFSALVHNSSDVSTPHILANILSDGRCFRWHPVMVNLKEAHSAYLLRKFTCNVPELDRPRVQFNSNAHRSRCCLRFQI